MSIPMMSGFRSRGVDPYDVRVSIPPSPGFDPTESWFRFLMMRGFVPVKSWGFDPCRPKVVVPTGTCGADVTRVSIPVSRARAAIWITDGPEGFDPGLPSLDSVGFDPAKSWVSIPADQTFMGLMRGCRSYAVLGFNSSPDWFRGC